MCAFSNPCRDLCVRVGTREIVLAGDRSNYFAVIEHMQYYVGCFRERRATHSTYFYLLSCGRRSAHAEAACAWRRVAAACIAPARDA